MGISLDNLSFTPSFAGVWTPVDEAYLVNGFGNIANSFYGNVNLGADQLTGMIMTGWSYLGFDNQATEITPVNFAILEQQADGTLLLATENYVSSSLTNGGGSVIVTDFNGDGKSDVFLAGHNESPFLQAQNTALISNDSGTFTMLTFDEAIMAHDAQLAIINGTPTVITATFTEDGGTFDNPFFTWNGSGFSSNERGTANTVSGQSIAAADFNGDGNTELVFGDFTFGPGYQYNSNNMRIAVYGLTDWNVSAEPLTVIAPYFETRAEYANISSLWGLANTHTPRILIDDFNHDGLPDIIALQSLWHPDTTDWPSAMQMLQNEGDFNFIDVTDTLNTEYNFSSNEADYQTQVVDLDGSGINSYLSGARTYVSTDRQNNFLLLNDGTGQLHSALGEEFVTMGQAVVAYVSSIANATSPLNSTTSPTDPAQLYVPPTTLTPEFHGYLTASGNLNFVAELNASYLDKNGNWMNNKLVLVNVPVEINITTDFDTAITITDRNNSQLIRTFAGDDIIYQNGAAITAHIDGGLGHDVIIMDAASIEYTMDDGVLTGTGINDTLVNIERIQFTDGTLALDTSGNAGQTYRLYQAAFDRLPDTPGLAHNVNLLDTVLSLHDLSSAFTGSAEFIYLYGANSSNDTFITALYQNVLDRLPDEGGFNSWNDLLTGGQLDRADVLIGFSESPENIALVGSAIENGIWLG